MKSSNWMKGLGVVLTLFVFANSAMCFWDHSLIGGIINMVLGIFDTVMVVRLWHLEKPRISVITMFEKCVLDENGVPDIGCARSPCYKNSYIEAEQVLRENRLDVCDSCYRFAVISVIGSEIYPTPVLRRFYMYDEVEDSYIPIETPEILKNIDICGIG